MRGLAPILERSWNRLRPWARYYRGLAVSDENQRSSVRYSVEAFVKVDHQSEEWVLRTRDLSETGLFLYTKVAHGYPFAIGSRLRIELYDYNTFVSCLVTVARVVVDGSSEAEQYPVGFGVQITEIDDENRNRLRAILARVEGGKELY